MCAGALATGAVFVVGPSDAQAKTKTPGKVKIASAKAKATTVTVKIKKAKRAVFYQYKIGTNKKVSKGTKSAIDTERSHAFDGLRPNKRYYVKVRAFGQSWGKWSKVKSVKTGSSPASSSQVTGSQQASTGSQTSTSGSSNNTTGQDTGTYAGDGYEISNVSLSVQGTTAKLTCSWKNTSEKDLEADPHYRAYQDGYRIAEGYLFGETMQPGYSQQLERTFSLRNSTSPVQIVISDTSLSDALFDRTFLIS